VLDQFQQAGVQYVLRRARLTIPSQERRRLRQVDLDPRIG